MKEAAISVPSAESEASSNAFDEDKADGNLARMAKLAGRRVEVMTVAADRYGVDGVLLYVDEWGLCLQIGGASNPTFVPWVAVIQADFGHG